MNDRSNVFALLFRALFIVTLVYFTYLLLAKPSGRPPGFITNDKVAHFIGFFMLAFVVEVAFPRTKIMFKVILLCIYGLATEVMQFFIPYRTFSWWDWAADIGGVLAFQPLVLPLHRYLLALVGENYRA